MLKQKGIMGIKGKSGAQGEIVEVEGGHIIRATGRKDRHSKVFTAKGPRDRRVRLSAHTAIQFYDVQDRLGFDRPSKAVDWLMSKAKDSIDKLAQLPPWNPPQDFNNFGNNSCTDQVVLPVPERTESIYHQDDDHEHDENGVGECMKSFFPISTTTTTHQQDLCLSLHTSDNQGPGHGTHSGLGLFPGPGSMGFDTGPNAEWEQHHDLGRFTRMMGWNGGQFPQQLGFNNNNSNNNNNNNNNNFQRGTLQSSFYPLLGQPQGFPGPGSGSFMGFCNPELLHGGGGELSNRASSSSLSPEDSSQH